MPVRELLCVVGVAYVAGFAPTPDELSGRSVDAPPPQCTLLPEDDKCVMAGINPGKKRGKCIGFGYDPPGEDGKYNDVGFCYSNAGGPSNCETMRKSCETDLNSASCTQYKRWINQDSTGLQTCPKPQAFDADTFCTIALPGLKDDMPLIKLPPGKYCDSVSEEDDCAKSVIVGKSPTTNTTSLYQQCMWNNNKCVKRRRTGYDEAYICENTCEIVGSRDILPADGTKCGTGNSFDAANDRLDSKEECESFASQTVINGLPNSFFPCVGQQPVNGVANPNCDPAFLGSRPTCMCVESDRTGAPGCAGTELQCCKEVSGKGYTCVDCESL